MTPRESSLLVLLAALAGWMDALSFTALGKVFCLGIFLGLLGRAGRPRLRRHRRAPMGILAALCGNVFSALVVGAIDSPEVTSARGAPHPRNRGSAFA